MSTSTLSARHCLSDILSRGGADLVELPDALFDWDHEGHLYVPDVVPGAVPGAGTVTLLIERGRIKATMPDHIAAGIRRLSERMLPRYGMIRVDEAPPPPRRISDASPIDRATGWLDEPLHVDASGGYWVRDVPLTRMRPISLIPGPGMLLTPGHRAGACVDEKRLAAARPIVVQARDGLFVPITRMEVEPKWRTWWGAVAGQ